MRRSFGWLASALTAFAFLALVVLFIFQTRAYLADVVTWAERDLHARVEVAARHLEDALQTQNVKHIEDFGERCRAEGLTLVISDRDRVLFRYDGIGMEGVDDCRAQTLCNGYQIELRRSAAEVKAPFDRALPGFILAALVGSVGMLLLFFLIYRQRVRIQELARLEQFRREFISDFSHELKTPLTGICASADLLATLALKPEQQKLADLILRESKRLDALAQDVLDLSRLEHAQTLQDLQMVDLQNFLKEIGEAYPTVEVQADKVDLRCDPLRLGQAIRNLLTNALRHAHATTIRLRSSKGAHGVEIVVEDDGLGIPPESLPHLFERFYRVDSSRTASSGGTGLGLAIADRIVRLHGGRLVYEAVRPHGARFKVILPN